MRLLQPEHDPHGGFRHPRRGLLGCSLLAHPSIGVRRRVVIETLEGKELEISLHRPLFGGRAVRSRWGLKEISRTRCTCLGGRRRNIGSARKVRSGLLSGR